MEDLEDRIESWLVERGIHCETPSVKKREFFTMKKYCIYLGSEKKVDIRSQVTSAHSKNLNSTKEIPSCALEFCSPFKKHSEIKRSVQIRESKFSLNYSGPPKSSLEDDNYMSDFITPGFEVKHKSSLLSRRGFTVGDSLEDNSIKEVPNFRSIIATNLICSSILPSEKLENGTSTIETNRLCHRSKIDEEDGIDLTNIPGVSSLQRNDLKTFSDSLERDYSLEINETTPPPTPLRRKKKKNHI